MTCCSQDLDEFVETAARAFVEARLAAGASRECARVDLLTLANEGLRNAVPALRPADGIDPLDPRALHGLAGRFVELVEPHTESDPAALLVQFLGGVGCLLGRDLHYRVNADMHCGNLFVLLVGNTSRGRKGTSLRLVLDLLKRVDPAWSAMCVQHGGLASGEGLVYSVRDARGSDPGVHDKRLLVVEGEFAAVLKVLAREGNTLSPILRNAWDTGNVSNINKSSPCHATMAHIGLLSHITRGELHRQLNGSDLCGGLMNRFLIVFVRRSKVLPFGGCPAKSDMDCLAGELKAVVSLGRRQDPIRMDEEAMSLWSRAYPILSADRYGPSGMATARAEAQVIRLALLYSALDQAGSIGRVHLEAALALWDYCDSSALHVFGDEFEDRVSGEVMSILRREGGWLSRTDLVNALGRHASGARLQGALDALMAANLVGRREEATGGRPRELFRARKARKAPILELCSLSSHVPGGLPTAESVATTT